MINREGCIYYSTKIRKMQPTLMVRQFVKKVSVYPLYTITDMQLLQFKRLFLEYLENSLGRSAKTVENYDRYLTRFLAFSKIKKPIELNEERISEFRLYLNRQAGSKVGGQSMLMKPQTQNYYLIALRAFLKFLNQSGVATLLPNQIGLTKVSDRTLGTISQKDFVSLLAGPTLSTLEGRRDRAILELLFSTGLRISELCGLEILDANLPGAELIVRGKHNTVRALHLSKTTVGAIKNYLAKRQDGEGALFVRCGKKSHVGEEARISARTVQRLLKYYAVKGGVTSRVTPQIIRHSLATELLSKGTDLKSVQVLLGHAHIATTEIYNHAVGASLDKVHKQFTTKRKNLK